MKNETVPADIEHRRRNARYQAEYRRRLRKAQLLATVELDIAVIDVLIKSGLLPDGAEDDRAARGHALTLFLKRALEKK